MYANWVNHWTIQKLRSLHPSVSAYHLNNLHADAKQEIIPVKCVAALNDKCREALVTVVFCKLGVTVIIIIIEILTFRLWLGNIHLSWDVVINRIRLGGLIFSLKVSYN
jgi:hypothetical protein